MADNNTTISEFFKGKYLNCLTFINNSVLLDNIHQFDYTLKLDLCNPDTNTIDVLVNYVTEVATMADDKLWASACAKWLIIGPIVASFDFEAEVSRLLSLASKDPSIELDLRSMQPQWYNQLQSIVSTAEWILSSPKVLSVCKSLLVLRLKIDTWIKLLRYASLFKKLLTTNDNNKDVIKP